MNSANLPDIVSYSSPRWLPCASPPPFWIKIATIAGTRFCAMRLSSTCGSVISGSPIFGPSCDHDERRLRAALVLRGHVDRDRALVVLRVRLDDQRLRVVRIHRAEHVARDAGIELAVLRLHGELLDLAVRNALDRLALGGRRVVGADDEIAVLVDGRVRALAGDGGERGAPGPSAGRVGGVGRAGGGLRRWLSSRPAGSRRAGRFETVACSSWGGMVRYSAIRHRPGEQMKSGNPVLRSDTFDAVPAGERMTINGTINKTAMMLALVMITAIYTWGRFTADKIPRRSCRWSGPAPSAASSSA